MANSGGVSGVFARGHPRLTALCELAVNMARVASQTLLCGVIQASCHLRLLQLQTPPLRSKSPVGRPRVLVNCVGQGRFLTVVPLSRPLLAAFATIAAMIKCFNSIKNCYYPRHDDYCPYDSRRSIA